MGTKTDLVNVVNSRKLQPFSHEGTDENLLCHVFKSSSTDK